MVDDEPALVGLGAGFGPAIYLRRCVAGQCQNVERAAVEDEEEVLDAPARPAAGVAVGGPAPAGGHRPGHRARTGGVPVRRTPVEP